MNQVHPAFLFLAEAESHTNGEVHGIARRSVNTTERGCVWRHARLEIVLRLVVLLVGQIVDGEVEIDIVANLLRDTQVYHVESCGSNRSIRRVKAIVADMAVAE